jgi:hypothetical protein
MDGIFCAGRAESNWDNQESYLRVPLKKSVSLKAAAVQRGLAIVRSRYQATTSEDTAGLKTLSEIL